MKSTVQAVVTVLAVLIAVPLIGIVGCTCDWGGAGAEKPDVTQAAYVPYESQTKKTEYSSQVDWNLRAENLVPYGVNPYYPPLMPGHSYVMEEPNFSDEGDEGYYRKEVVVLDKTEPFDIPAMGGKFECAIVEEKEFLDGKQFSRSLNWYCIDKTTNTVYTMGEEAWETKDARGDMADTVTETWRTGEPDDFKIIEAGLIFPGTWLAGGKWLIDTAEGQAFVGGEAAESGLTMDTPAGTFENCVRTREYDILDPEDVTDKIWAPGVGLVFDTSDGKLVESDALKDRDLSPATTGKAPATTTKPPVASSDPGPEERISEEEAKAIALKAVPGEITEIGIERKRGDNRYVIEVVPADGGPETDVIIDPKTGEVVGLEK